MNSRLSIAIGILLLSLVTPIQAEMLGTGFSYQGRLLRNGSPAQGTFAMRFELFPSAAGAIPCADALVVAEVRVEDGLFLTTLDFGTNVFGGDGCWLEIAVRTAGETSDYVVLAPRQALTPAPYSLYTLKAKALTGPLPEDQLPANVARLDADQTFLGTVTFGGQVVVGSPETDAGMAVAGGVEASSFWGDGAGLSNLVASSLSARLAQRLWKIHIPFVTVTNVNNPPDHNGKGSVAYPYRIGKFEISNRQYAAFLNAVAIEDPNGLYDTNMAATVHGGIERSGQAGDHLYSVKPGHEHRPVVWVDFHDALRFCNWLHNGQPSGRQTPQTTEDGAYTITPAGMLANNIQRNPQARFWLPSDDEWYKAAYHQPWEQGGDVHGYWLYPTRNFIPPISELPPGGANSANVCCETGRQSTDIGAYVNAPSYYGTFDQAGNVQEWTEEILFVTNRRLRGGSWDYNEFYAGSDDLEFDTTDYPATGIGFRVAGAAE